MSADDRDGNRAMPGSVEPDDQQRRVLRVLVISQILSGAGLAAGITVGGLLAQDMLGTTALAGLPSALFTAGSALAAIGIGRLSQGRGRRAGLATGYAVGAAGGLGVIAASLLDSPAVLFVALFVYGAGTATNLQARYAGADLASPGHRARAISTVLVATTFGGVLGPNLATPSGALAERLGIPHLAGPFLLAALAYAAASVMLATRLRPDPLLLARERAAMLADRPSDVGPRAAPDPIIRPPAAAGLPAGVAVLGISQLIMLAVMTMTPINLHDHGFGTTAVGMVIAVHVAAMYLPSPLTGRLVDRYGARVAAMLAALTLLLAGAVAAAAPPHSLPLAALALALLGLGWNLGLVSGTAIVTDSVPLERRATSQGAADVAVAIAGAAGGLGSGIVVDHAGYPALAIGAGVLALGILIPAVAVARSRAA